MLCFSVGRRFERAQTQSTIVTMRASSRSEVPSGISGIDAMIASHYNVMINDWQLVRTSVAVGTERRLH